MRGGVDSGAAAALFAVCGLLAGCGGGQSQTTPPPKDAAGLVRLLEREGYKPPEAPKPPPGASVGSAEWSVRFDTRYGKPVAYLTRGGLDVLVVSGSSSTPRVPQALWLRSGSAIVVGYLRSHAGVGQWRELTEAL